MLEVTSKLEIPLEVIGDVATVLDNRNIIPPIETHVGLLCVCFIGGGIIWLLAVILF